MKGTAPDDRYYPSQVRFDDTFGKVTFGPRLIETFVAFSLYGVAIPLSLGRRRLKGNLIWARPLAERRQLVRAGVAVPTKDQVDFSYFATFAFSYGYTSAASPETSQVSRIWADGTLVFDRAAASLRTINSNLSFAFYGGSESQLPDQTIEAFEGPGMVPAFRGQIYLVVKDLPVEPFDNKIPDLTIEVADDVATGAVETNIAYPDSFGGVESLPRVFADWNRQKGFISDGHSARPPAGVIVYDLADKVFQARVPFNTSSIGGAAGVNTASMAYMPWNGKFFCQADASALNQLALLVDPYAGTVEAAGEAAANRGAYGMAAKVITTDAIVSFYLTRRLGGDSRYNIHMWDSRETVITEIFDGTAVAAIVHMAPGEEDNNCCTFYLGVAETIPEPDVSHNITKLTLDRSVLLNVRSSGPTALSDYLAGIQVEDNWLPYTGSASPEPKVVGLHLISADRSMLVFYDSAEAVKVDIETKAVIWRNDTEITGFPTIDLNGQRWLDDVSADLLAWPSGRDVIELDLNTGAVARYANQLSAASVIDNSAIRFDSTTRRFFGRSTGTAVNVVEYAGLGDGQITLSSFIVRSAVYAGFEESDIEIDPGLTDEIDGSIIDQQTTLADVLDKLKTGYGVEVFESGDKIKVTKRIDAAVPVSVTVSDLDLIQVEGGPLSVRREQETALPAITSVTYVDKALDYAFSTQTTRRHSSFATSGSQNSLNLELPLVMTAEQAKRIAFNTLYSAEVHRLSYTFGLPQEFIAVEPGDVVTVNLGARSFTVQAVEVDYRADFNVDIAAQGFQASADFQVPAFSGFGYDQTIPGVSFGQMIPIDTFLLSPFHDTATSNGTVPFYYVLVPGIPADSFNELTGYQSSDNQAYRQEQSSDDVFPVGSLTEPLASPRPGTAGQLDRLSTVKLRIVAGNGDLLVSLGDEALVFDGRNKAIVGKPGRWEVVQFATVTQELDGTFTLSNLLRGQDGTADLAVAGLGDSNLAQGIDIGKVSKPGDLFILLGAQWLKRAETAIGEVDSDEFYKAIDANTDLDDVLPVSRLMRGYGIRPRAPVDIRAERDGNGNLTVKWERAGRTFGFLRDGSDEVTLSETERDDYEVALIRFQPAGAVDNTEFFDAANVMGYSHEPGQTLVPMAGITKTVVGAHQVAFSADELLGVTPNPTTNPAQNQLFGTVREAGLHDPQTPGVVAGIADPADQQTLSFRDIWVRVRQFSNLAALDEGGQDTPGPKGYGSVHRVVVRDV